MSAPAGILAASTLLWGWMCGLSIVALPLSVLLEAWRFGRVRWDLSAKDFQRIADLCTWTFVLQAGYLIVAKGWPLPILQILEWLPLSLAPLVLAQLYSSAGRVELSALFLSLRSESGGTLAHERVDLSFGYAAVCVLAAGAANVRTPWYFAAAAALIVWALWGVRSRRYPLWLWTVMVVIGVSIAYAGHHGLSRLQTWVFNVAIEFFQLDLARTDPYRSTTDIGEIGELKSSDRILLRVAAPRDVATPMLLHRASYDAYVAATWFARDGQFNEQLADDGAGRWLVDRRQPAGAEVIVSETLVNGIGVLALPAATATVSGLGTALVRRNRLGTIRVERAPGMISYAAASADEARFSAPPRPSDLQLPAPEAAALNEVVGELGLSSLAPEEAVRALEAYFAERFRYSTFRAERVGARHAVADFLRNSRSGHCEYFATATVLLARAAGIPARYATGFSVQEYSPIEGRYLVRERHAHAWARLYLNGAWHDVDTTPPQWFAAESRAAKLWEPLTDLGSWLVFRLNEWRARPGDAISTLAWLAVLAVLISTLLWRLFRGKGFTRARSLARTDRVRRHAEPNDPFADVAQRIASKGLPRFATETAREWVHRIGPRFDPRSRSLLEALLRWHYRERFDPLRMRPTERQAYAEAAMRWCEHDPTPAPSESERREAVQTGTNGILPHRKRQRG